MPCRPSSTGWKRHTAGGDDDLPEDVDERLGEIETAIGAIDERPFVFDAAEVARAGAFISIDSAGQLRVERGYVRAEDELPVAPEADEAGNGNGESAADADQPDRSDVGTDADAAEPVIGHAILPESGL